MKLEKQVPSLELCKKLKELGYPQEGLFMWDTNEKLRVGIDKVNHPHSKTAYPDTIELEVSGEDWSIAPTVAELGEWLPHYVISRKVKDEWIINTTDDRLIKEANFTAESEVDVRSYMLIWLVENKHLEFK